METTERGHRSLPVPNVFSSEIFASIKKKKVEMTCLVPGKFLGVWKYASVCVCAWIHVCIRLCVHMSQEIVLMHQTRVSSDLQRLVPNDRT